MSIGLLHGWCPQTNESPIYLEHYANQRIKMSYERLSFYLRYKSNSYFTSNLWMLAFSWVRGRRTFLFTVVVIVELMVVVVVVIRVARVSHLCHFFKLLFL